MLKKVVGRIAALCVMTFLPMSAAHAWDVVFDPSNYAKNAETAAEQVKSEVYQNTNIVYQYQMMANQIKQSVQLATAPMVAEYNQITSDISATNNYVSSLQSLYGQVQNDAQFMTRVQSLVTQSGKTPTQWLSDMNTLLRSGDSMAKTLFQQGNDVLSHVQTLATRRQQIQSQLNLTPTQQATAQLTTHMLDIVASQNEDMLKMMASKQQSDAIEKQSQLANAEATNAAQTSLQALQSAERAAYQSKISSSTTLGQ
jgi:P-type conjugative transfer protein TrbJ